MATTTRAIGHDSRPHCRANGRRNYLSTSMRQRLSVIVDGRIGGSFNADSPIYYEQTWGVCPTLGLACGSDSPFSNGSATVNFGFDGRRHGPVVSPAPLLGDPPTAPVSEGRVCIRSASFTPPAATPIVITSL